jgi:hypothetical protein
MTFDIVASANWKQIVRSAIDLLPLRVKLLSSNNFIDFASARTHKVISVSKVPSLAIKILANRFPNIVASGISCPNCVELRRDIPGDLERRRPSVWLRQAP